MGDESASQFRNSGVYIYDHYEVQIYDTDALLKALDPGHYSYLHTDVDGGNRLLRADIDSDQVRMYHEYKTTGAPRYWDKSVPVDGCITGIPYLKGDKEKYDTIGELSSEAGRLRDGGSNTMIIDVTPTDPHDLGAGIELVVTLNGGQTFAGRVDSQTGNGVNEEQWDTLVYLQSHWGSGVKSTSATITPKTEPEE